MEFEDLITKEAEQIRALYKAIDETFRKRHKGKREYEEWEKACAACHSYASPLDIYLHKAYSQYAYRGEQLEFVLQFLKLDPRFFRSGYIKEEMLKRIGRSELNSEQTERLRAVLLDAVKRRGGREFRRYCRLAKRYSDLHFREQLVKLSSVTGEVGSRAKMMYDWQKET